GYVALVELEPTGGGAYLFRQSESRAGRELVFQAPHSVFDRGTGELALASFLEAGDRARALFVNTMHRYERKGRAPGERDSGADAAHNPEHLFSIATAALLETVPDLEVVQ